ncbi:MAG: acyl-CoA dehydrogenase family protein [Firmicutes bacterium]|nr:acyl-CoA dehydrogenase family protein [Bacillota bacterium]
MLDLTPEQSMLQMTTRKIAKEKIAPLAAEMDREQKFPTAILDLFNRDGFLSMMLPEEYGGINSDTVSLCLVIEELAKVCASTAVTLTGHITGSVAFLRSSSEEQKQKFLSKQGQFKIFAISISEPEAGSDVSAIKTAAVAKDDHYLVNGTKCFVTNGGLADLYIVFIRTSADRKRGISTFVVEKETPGFKVGKKEDKMGLRGSNTTELVFEDARIPLDNLLGGGSGGFEVVMKTMDKMRTIVGALALGIAEGALEYAKDYVKTRKQFGRPLSDFQAIRFMLADMATRVDASRLLVYRAAEMVDRGMNDVSMYSSMAKYYASDVAMYVTTDVVQLLGGYGYMKDYPVERMMRDAKVTQIFEGTNQIQRLVIAKQMLL